MSGNFSFLGGPFDLPSQTSTTSPDSRVTLQTKIAFQSWIKAQTKRFPFQEWKSFQICTFWGKNCQNLLLWGDKNDKICTLLGKNLPLLFSKIITCGLDTICLSIPDVKSSSPGFFGVENLFSLRIRGGKVFKILLCHPLELLSGITMFNSNLGDSPDF